MSDIFSPIGRSLPGIAGPTLVTGVISDPPRGLIGLTPGTILKGTVIGRGSDGLTAVATDRGTVNVATSAHLPPGSIVTLEVRNAGDRLQVLILAVEGQNARTPASQAATTTSHAGAGAAGPSSSGGAGAASESQAQPSPRPAPPAIEIVGTSVKAIIVQAPATTSLLPAPVTDIEPFVPPPTQPIIPPDAVQKAQALAHTQMLLEAAGSEQPSTGAPRALILEPGGTPLPAPGQQQPNAIGSGTPTPQPGATSLQPEVAQRIAALFAAADGAPQGQHQTLGAAVAPSSTTAMPAKQAGVVPAALAGNPLLAANLVPATTAAAATPGAPRILAAGTELTLHVVAVLPVKGGEIEIAPDAAKLAGTSAPLIGRVLGYTRAGLPVIDTPAGLVMMQQKTRLPVGAQVALVLEPVIAPPIAPLPPITTPQQALLSLSSGWPTLDDLVSVLRSAAAPDAGTPPPPPGIPQTGPKLAAGLANAIAALRTGEVERLLGPLLAARKLPEGKDDAIKRLKDEFAQLSELAKDRPAVDWRALYLPIYDERIGLTQINLYYRHGGGGQDDPEKKERGTRFLVDVNFAVLGAFQLDGLIRGKRFDLMIRSRRRLSQSQRRDIIGIFEQALELGGCTGGLDFRTVEVFPVSPLDELRQAHDQLTA